MFKRAALSLSVSLMMLTSQEAFSALYVEQYSPEPEYVDSTSSAVKGSDSDLVIYNSKKESGAVSGVKVPPKQFVYSAPANGPAYVPPATASAPIPAAKSSASGSKLADDVANAVANASKTPAAPFVAQKQVAAPTSSFLTNSAVAAPAAKNTETAFLIKEPSSKVLTAASSTSATSAPLAAPIGKPVPIVVPKKTAHFGTDERFSKQYMKVMSEQAPAWTVIWRSGSDFQITVPFSLQYKDPVDLASQLDTLYKLNSTSYRENRTVVVLGPSK